MIYYPENSLIDEEVIEDEIRDSFSRSLGVGDLKYNEINYYSEKNNIREYFIKFNNGASGSMYFKLDKAKNKYGLYFNNSDNIKYDVSFRVGKDIDFTIDGKEYNFNKESKKIRNKYEFDFYTIPMVDTKTRSYEILLNNDISLSGNLTIKRIFGSSGSEYLYNIAIDENSELSYIESYILDDIADLWENLLNSKDSSSFNSYFTDNVKESEIDRARNFLQKRDDKEMLIREKETGLAHPDIKYFEPISKDAYMVSFEFWTRLSDSQYNKDLENGNILVKYDNNKLLIDDVLDFSFFSKENSGYNYFEGLFKN